MEYIDGFQCDGRTMDDNNPWVSRKTTVELEITAGDLVSNVGDTPIFSYMVQHLLVGDLNGNGEVDIFDIVLAADNYGKEYQ